MANRTFAAMRKMFNWAFAQGIIESSPCTGVTAPAKPNKRDRVLSDDEIKAIMRATQDVSSNPFNGIVQLLVYTAQRRTEVAQMQWDELNLDACQWTLPASRSKNGKSHIVHLSRPALDVLNSINNLGSYVFTTHPKGEKPFQNYGHAKTKLDTACEVTGWVLHDIRRTVVTGIANMGIPPHIADKLLNHQSGTISGVAAVYQRAEFMDERREALISWASYVTALLDEPDANATEENTRSQGEREKASNIIQFNQAAQQ